MKNMSVSNHKSRNTVSDEKLSALCVIAPNSEHSLIKAESLAYAVFQRPDFETAKQFFLDFGLQVVSETSQKVFFRGRDGHSVITILEKGQKKIKALGLRVAPDALVKITEATGKAVQSNEVCVGGDYIALTDPDGLEIHLCNDLNTFDSVPPHVQHHANFSEDKQRVLDVVRHDIAARTVNRLGHTVLAVSEIKKSIEWYQETLGMIVSDFQFLPNDGLPVAAFMRFDCGDTPTDHHSIAIASIIETGHVHTAYEMDDFEEVAIGGEWNRSKGYTHAWGIGRHVLGSQIFDYWREPKGDLFEHYADGDLFDNSVEPGYQLLSKHAQHQWGPASTKEFTGENRPLTIIKSLLSRLPSSDDLSFSRLKRILKAINS